MSPDFDLSYMLRFYKKLIGKLKVVNKKNMK